MLLQSQSFTRSELPTLLQTPWEIQVASDHFLWISEANGVVSRVHPLSGEKKVVFKAADYFGGSSEENSVNCFQPKIGAGTLGMALHPQFGDTLSSYIYLVYSYNAGTAPAPLTKFRIKRLFYNLRSDTVTADSNLVNFMPSGYDHLGGRLLCAKKNGKTYLFFTVGDNGVSETNSPNCYVPASSNPNLLAQDPGYKNGKVHRFNMDGSIPYDNPLPGNSFYTRGHRNPQGLAYHPKKEIVYEIEHGDRTDDEINILESGMNYGWKFVRGYHSDNNYPGEQQFIATYTPYPGITGDTLKEPLYSWCATIASTISNNASWCTPAPSDAIYYGHSAIEKWTNSLLVVTLKKGDSTRQEVYQFKLDTDGRSLATSTTADPNPKRYFGSDQLLNGRLRDIALSADGKTIYLINNGGADRDKITCYSLNATPGDSSFSFNVYPVPSEGLVNVYCSESIETIQVYDLLGQEIKALVSSNSISLSELPVGAYMAVFKTRSGITVRKRLLRI